MWDSGWLGEQESSEFSRLGKLGLELDLDINLGFSGRRRLQWFGLFELGLNCSEDRVGKLWDRGQLGRVGGSELESECDRGDIMAL